MKKFILAALIPAALAGVAAPALAQPMPPRHNDAWALTPARNAEIRSDIQRLRADIDRAQARRTISPREASGLRREAADIQRQYAAFSRGRLDRNEVRRLQDRVNDVRAHLRMERRDWDGRRG